MRLFVLIQILMLITQILVTINQSIEQSSNTRWQMSIVPKFDSNNKCHIMFSADTGYGGPIQDKEMTVKITYKGKIVALKTENCSNCNHISAYAIVDIER
jgi:hypothetical protein